MAAQLVRLVSRSLSKLRLPLTMPGHQTKLPDLVDMLGSSVDLLSRRAGKPRSVDMVPGGFGAGWICWAPTAEVVGPGHRPTHQRLHQPALRSACRSGSSTATATATRPCPDPGSDLDRSRIRSTGPGGHGAAGWDLAPQWTTGRIQADTWWHWAARSQVSPPAK